MSFFLIKSILALFLLAAAVGAVTSMLTMMGKAEKKNQPQNFAENTHYLWPSLPPSPSSPLFLGT